MVTDIHLSENMSRKSHKYVLGWLVGWVKHFHQRPPGISLPTGQNRTFEGVLVMWCQRKSNVTFPLGQTNGALKIRRLQPDLCLKTEQSQRFCGQRPPQSCVPASPSISRWMCWHYESEAGGLTVRQYPRFLSSCFPKTPHHARQRCLLSLHASCGFFFFFSDTSKSGKQKSTRYFIFLLLPLNSLSAQSFSYSCRIGCSRR